MSQSNAYLLNIRPFFSPDESVRIYLHKYHKTMDRMHYHDFHELVIVKHGSGQHMTKDDNYPIYPGDIFLIRPGDHHGYCEMQQLEILNIIYHPANLNNLLENLIHTSGYKFFFETDPKLTGKYRFKNRITMPNEDMLQINELALQMQYEQQSQPLKWQFMLEMIFMQILCLICRAFEQNPPQYHETQEISQILRYLENHYMQKITLKTISVKFGKSIPTLSRLFKSTLNESPIAYLLRLRLEKAATQLRSNSSSIACIAEHCGFCDSNYFSKMFSREFNIPPRQYRHKFKMKSL
jgi:AraC-like DNA-binding protein